MLELTKEDAEVLKDGLMYTHRVYMNQVANIKAKINNTENEKLAEVLLKDLQLAEARLQRNHNLKEAFGLV